MNRLLQAARETIIFQGVDQPGISAIATRSGVNKVLVYRYFGGWNGIIEALFQQMLSSISEHPDLMNQSEIGTLNQLSAWETYMLHFYQQIKADPAFLVLLRWQIHNQEKALAQRLNELLERSIQQRLTLEDMNMKISRLLIDGVTYSAVTSTGSRGSKDDAMAAVIQHIFGHFKHSYQIKKVIAPPADICA